MTKPLHPEAVDLAQLTTRLRDALPQPVVGTIEGRTALRDAALDLLECSQLEAEQLIDTMVARGFLRPELQEDGASVWRLRVV